MKIVKTLITNRLRTFRMFGSWFETTSVHFVWVLVLQKRSNPLQTTVRKLHPNTFTQWTTETPIKNLYRRLRARDAIMSSFFNLVRMDSPSRNFFTNSSTSSHWHCHSGQQKSQHLQKMQSSNPSTYNSS